MMESTLTSKGQTTIPAEVRDLLQAKPGTKLRYVPTQDGGIKIYAKRFTLDDIVGIVPNNNEGFPTQEKMDKAIIQGATERYLRYLNQDKP